MLQVDGMRWKGPWDGEDYGVVAPATVRTVGWRKKSLGDESLNRWVGERKEYAELTLV